MRFSGPLLLAVALVTVPGGFAQTSAAQASRNDPSTTDIQRLQDSINDASRDITQARSRDWSLGSQLQSELDEARDEAIYLKVKARKGEPIAQSEYADLRDRIENIRARARGDSAGGYTPPAGSRTGDDRSTSPAPTGTVGRSSNPNEIAVDTEFDVRLQTPLSSKTAQVEDRFEATTAVDLRDANGRVIVPAGSVMRGVVSAVNKAGRIERKGSLQVAFDRITINGRSYPIRATVTQALESEGIAGEKEKIGIGAGAGAILGAILGGVKGAVAGILIGGGGTIAATEGKDVELPAGMLLRVRLDAPISLQR
jgi:hypothetical protein